MYTLLALGVMCFVFAPLPFVKGLSNYILPLAYLNWIGLGLIALGTLVWMKSIAKGGKFAYVRKGEPFAGRVLNIQRDETKNEAGEVFRYVAHVQFLHPETALPQELLIPHDETWQLSQADRYACTLQPGDEVTLVGMPGKIDKTARVYGFLGLNPEREYFLKNGRPIQGVSPFTAIMVAFLIAGAVLLFMAGFEAIMFSVPLSGGWALPVGFAVGGFFFAGVLALLFRASAKASGTQVGNPIAGFVVGGFFGAIAGPVAFMLLNSGLDAGAPVFEPVEIVGYWETTHNFVIRDYEVEYRRLNEADTDKMHIRFSQIANLGDAGYGALEIRPGQFGHEWAKAIRPAVWEDAKVADVDGPVYRLTIEVQAQAEEEGPPETMTIGAELKPVIYIDEEEFAPVPEELLPRMVEDLELTGGTVELVTEPDAGESNEDAV